MTGIIIIFSYLICLVIYFAKSGANTVLNASKWFISVNLFLVIVYTFSGIHYYDKVSYYAVTFMVINVIILLMSEHCGYTALKRNRLYITSRSLSLPRKIRILGILCIIGTSFYVADILGRGGFSLGVREGGKLSLLGAIGSFFLCNGLLVWLYSLFVAIRKGRSPSLLGYLCLICYLSMDVITAARSQTITVAISTFIIFLYAKKKSGFKISAHLGRFIVLGSIFCSFVLGYIYFISTTRSIFEPAAGNVAFSERWFGARMDAKTRHALEKFGLLSKPVSDMLFYYSHQFSNYSIYFEHYDYPPTMGLSTFRYVTRRLEVILGPLNNGVSKEIDNIFEKANMSPHTWGTYQKNLLIDYGKGGAIIANIILGFLMGLSRKRVEVTPSPINVVLGTLICTGAVLSINSTPFVSVGWAYPLFTTLLFKLSLGVRVFRKNEDVLSHGSGRRLTAKRTVVEWSAAVGRE